MQEAWVRQVYGYIKASGPDGITVRELAQRVRRPTAKVAAALKTLDNVQVERPPAGDSGETAEAEWVASYMVEEPPEDDENQLSAIEEEEEFEDHPGVIRREFDY